jgi:biopolymer transport protein ExbD
MKRSGARRWTEARGSISARGLVPFLDTLFNLLFALLAISAASAPTSFDLLRLRLPRVESSPDARAPMSAGLLIAVDADGKIHPAGTDVALRTREELDRTLAALVADAVPEEVPIEIQAEALCPHGIVVELLQHLRVLGFSDVRLAAISRAGGPGLFGGEQ